MAARDSRLLAKPPLRLILIVPFVLQISVAVGLTGWLSIRNGQKAVHEVAQQFLGEVSTLTRERIPIYLESSRVLNEIHANAFELGQLDLTADIRTLGPQFFKSIQTFEQVNFTAFANPRGEYIGARRQPDGSLQLGIIDAATNGNLQYYTTDAAGNFGTLLQDIQSPPPATGRPWYTAAVKAQAPTWTGVYTTRSTESLAITAAKPVYNNRGNLLGVLSTTISLVQINQFLETLKIGQSGQVFIIDRAGMLISTSTGEQLYRVINRNGIEEKTLLAATESTDPTTRATAQHLQDLPKQVELLQLTQTFAVQTQQGREFVQITSLPEDTELDWRIIVVALESDFMEQIYANTRTTILLCAIALVLAILLGIITARWITQPLLQLNQAAKAIAQGNLQQHNHSIPLGAGRIHEVGELTHSFHQMTEQLQTSFNQLQALNAALTENESRLNQFFEALPVGVVVHDPSGQLIYANQVAKNLLEIHKLPKTKMNQLAEIFQAYLAETNIPYPIAEMPVVRALQGETTYIDNMELVRSERTIPLEVWGSPIFNEQGEIVYTIAAFQDISDRKQAESQLIYNALHDALTDLPNRSLLMQRLELAIHRAEQSEGYYFAVLFLDLDQFKIINDSLGHLVGDQLLITVAQKLQRIIQPTDLAARLGGDEFMILLEAIDGIQAAVRIAEQIFAELGPSIPVEGRNVFITASMGIVFGTTHYTHASELLRDADIALYRAKAQGRAKYEIFDAEMHTQALKRMHLENDLRQAIEQQEFVIYYQPMVVLNTRQLIGFEALVRWQHPTEGLISPTEFIPVAEETGLIVPLGRWLLQSACQQLVHWRQQFPDMAGLTVSINLSGQDLQQANLVKTVEGILSQTGLEASSLTLEITESMLIENIESTIELLRQLRSRGIRISIDDFGTGYSSLSYLYTLPADHLKIDKSFVNQMQQGDKNHKIVQAIVSLSNQLQLESIAEGIETQQQLQWLQELGCELGQGYLFARPLAPEDIAALLSVLHRGAVDFS